MIKWKHLFHPIDSDRKWEDPFEVRKMSESIGPDFLRRTRAPYQLDKDHHNPAPRPPLELAYPEDAGLITLPAPEAFGTPPLDLRAALDRRRTHRRYGEQPLSLEELSFLLWYTQGVKVVTRRPSTLRTVPSAGARHPFETYLVLNRVTGLEPGLYRFIATRHALLALDTTPETREQIFRDCYDQTQIRTSAATFLWVAASERMTWRYDDRGYRFLFLDAGHICQNLYLAAEPLACGVCAIGSFDDPRLNATLGLDGEKNFVAYIASLGKIIQPTG